MAKLLLMYLEGPLQSWGLRARWDVRDTGEEPTKSGIIGMLGCAFGYKRGDRRLNELENALRLGVRVERTGSKLVDFQTVRGIMRTADGRSKGKPGDPETIVSPRTYLQDAAFLAVLDGPDTLLADCAEALQSPRWPIYLGRKACVPSRPVFETLTERYAGLREALLQHPWRQRSAGEPKPARLRCVIEDPSGSHVRPDKLEINPARMYKSRSVSVEWATPPVESTLEF